MITITNRTKISEIIRANPDSINAIASVAKPLEKLKNPLLRRVMASRVTLAEAASIGGCDLETLREVLLPLGFRFEENKLDNVLENKELKPQWLTTVPTDKIFSFDVRPVIDAGDDPLKAIVKKFGAIQDGEILCIINSFVPYPLINLLSKEALTYTLEPAPGEHHTWFLKRKQDANSEAKKLEDVKVIMDDEKSFAATLSDFDELSVERVDVRHLQMPAPMHTILDKLASLPNTQALYVYHKKVPVYLLEALNEDHFTVHILNLGEGDVRLLIYAN